MYLDSYLAFPFLVSLTGDLDLDFSLDKDLDLRALDFELESDLENKTYNKHRRSKNHPLRLIQVTQKHNWSN